MSAWTLISKTYKHSPHAHSPCLLVLQEEHSPEDPSWTLVLLLWLVTQHIACSHAQESFVAQVTLSLGFPICLVGMMTLYENCMASCVVSTWPIYLLDNCCSWRSFVTVLLFKSSVVDLVDVVICWLLCCGLLPQELAVAESAPSGARLVGP